MRALFHREIRDFKMKHLYEHSLMLFHVPVFKNTEKGFYMTIVSKMASLLHLA